MNTEVMKELYSLFSFLVVGLFIMVDLFIDHLIIDLIHIILTIIMVHIIIIIKLLNKKNLFRFFYYDTGY